MKTTGLIAPAWMLLLVTSACSTGERSPFSRPQRGSRVQVDPAEVASAQNAPEPDILPVTYYRAARFQESAGRFDLAIEQYRHAVAADPNYAAAYDRLGIILGHTGRHAEAVQALRKAIKIDPKDPALRNNLGFEHILRKDWSQAERELRRALVIDPKFDRARINLGVVMAFESRYDDALAEFRKVLPEPDAQYNLGLAYCTQKRYADARGAFEGILARYPGFEAARTQLDNLPPPRVGRTAVPRVKQEPPTPPETHSQADPAAIEHTDPPPVRIAAVEAEIDSAALRFAGEDAVSAIADARTDHDDVAPPVVDVVRLDLEPADLDGDGDVDFEDFLLSYPAAFATPWRL